MMPLFERLNQKQAELTSNVTELLPVDMAATTPDPENILKELHGEAKQKLKHELLGRIYAQSPQFFEQLIMDVLLAMGYGGRRRDLVQHLGRSHDGGIDGIVCQDELGLDRIFIQAKRLRPGSCVSVSQMRDFNGSLDVQRASKGIFVTTSHFSQEAREVIESSSKRIVLINGTALTDLMVRYNIGVRPGETYQFKYIAADYFTPHAGIAASRISASNQPRK